MRKISILLQLIILAVFFSCQDPVNVDNVTTPADQQQITRLFYEGDYFDIPSGSTLDAEIASRRIVVGKTFYTPLEKSTLYIFKDDNTFRQVIQKRYPAFDMGVIDLPTDKTTADAERSKQFTFDNQAARVQSACGDWSDFKMQWYFGTAATATTDCSLLQSYLMNFFSEFGTTYGLPTEIYFKTPSTGNLSAIIHGSAGSTAVFLGVSDEELIPNIVFGSGTPSMSAGTSMSWSLSRVASQDLYAIAGGEIKAVNKNTAISTTLISGLQQADQLASTAGKLYFVDGSTMYQANPYNGFKTTFGTGTWDGTEAMAASNGFIYAAQHDALWKVDATTGATAKLGNGIWTGTEALAASGGFVYAVQGNALWKVNTSTGAFVTLGSGTWTGTAAMTVIGDYLYAVQNSTLWKVHTGAGTFAPFGTDTWAGTTGMTTDGTSLYIVQNGNLYKINVSNATLSNLGSVPGVVALSNVSQ